LQSPVRQVAENAGDDGSVVVGKLLDANDLNRGFDAQTGEYVNMVKAGIIDPTKHRRVVDFMRPRRRFCAPATK